MYRRTSIKLLHQCYQLSETTTNGSAREAIPLLASRIQASCGGQQLSLARGAASSSSSGPSSGPASSRLDAGRSAAAASAASTSGSGETPLSFVARQQQALATMPQFPKLLGFSGAIPFLTLTPSFVTAAGFPELVDYCAQMQLMYGGCIVTFLGAVHWGLAMNGAALAAAGSKAAGALNERYVWSVVPSLAAVTALMMPPAQGSFSVAVLLGICYMSDASYFRSGYLPSWYMSLRGYLTLLALVGMLSTTWHYFQQDLAKARALMEKEDAARQERLAAKAAAKAAGAPAAAAAISGAAAGRK